MRVLYLNPIGQMGGAETSLVQLLASVREAEPEWQLCLVLGAHGPLVCKAEALGVTVRVVPIPSALAKLGDSKERSVTALLPGLLAAFTYVRRLRRIILAEQPQVIHSTGFKMHVLSAWACPRGIPLIWHIHDYVRSRPLMSRLLRWHARRCRAVIVNSQSVATDIRTTLMGKVRVECIYNAIDLDRFSPVGPRMDLDSICGLPAPFEPTIRVGLVATFAWWKGHRVFLKALSLLPRELPVRGYIVGGPVYQTAGSQESLKDLSREVERLGVTEHVGFTGHVDDPASAIRALDVVVHASTQPEPFGMVIIEGMACQKAIIASLGGGASEICADGVNSLTHSAGEPMELAKQIQRLANDEELRQRLGKAGKATAGRLCHSKRLAKELLALYREISGVLTRVGADSPLKSSLRITGE